jgi:hypothetical protein
MDAKKIDWAQILREINKHDTWENIAWHLEMHVSNLRKTMLSGREPKYSVGVTILAMYEKHCGKKETPMKKD